MGKPREPGGAKLSKNPKRMKTTTLTAGLLILVLVSGCMDDKECQEWSIREACVTMDFVKLECIDEIKFYYNEFQYPDPPDYIIRQDRVSTYSGQYCMEYELIIENYTAIALICPDEESCEEAKWGYPFHTPVVCFATFNCTIDELEGSMYDYAGRGNQSKVAITLTRPKAVNRCIETETRYVCTKTE
jgi:hypothetical protein